MIIRNLIKWLRNLFMNGVNTVRRINLKYAKPRIHMTPLVRACLLILRIYLLALILILIYKFITVARGG
jgi:hypothetical protein